MLRLRSHPRPFLVGAAPESRAQLVTPKSAGRFYSAPIFYNVTSNAGSGRTLPLGSLGKMGVWTGAFTSLRHDAQRHVAGFSLGSDH